MKLVRYQKNGTTEFGVLETQSVRRIDGSIFNNFVVTNDEYQLDQIKLLTPAVPSKIIAVGLNYATHANELGMKTHSEPVLFMKPPTALLAPEGQIIYPEMSKQVDYEAELVVVIKERCRHVSVDNANNAILGYCCGNDVTARDLQKIDNQWTRAKGFDTFAPIGPYIETEIDPANLHIQLFLNGNKKQDSTTANLMFEPQFLVHFVSQIMTLLPGDIIMTGTPPGVGPMQVGDTVEVTIEGLGTLRNSVK